MMSGDALECLIRERRNARAMVHAPRTEALEISPLQAGLLFLSRLDPSSRAYNLGCGWRLSGPLDEPAFRRALELIVARHESLRTSFDGEKSIQVVAPPGPIAIERSDLRGESAEVVEAAWHTFWTQPLDPERSPLFRVALVDIGEADRLFWFAVHHLVWDGWSVGIFLRELATSYRAFRRGDEPQLEPLEVQYADCAAWHKRRIALVGDAQLAYWTRHLEGATSAILTPDSTSSSAPARQRGVLHAFRIERDLVERIREVARQQKSSLFHTMLAAYAALLARYSLHDDFVVTLPAHARLAPGAQKLIGFFLNTLPLRIDVKGDPTFEELVARVREATVEAVLRSDVPYAAIIAALRGALPGRPQLLFTFTPDDDAPPDLDEGLGMSCLPVPTSSDVDAVAELGCFGIEERSGGVRFVMHADADRFGRATLERLQRGFQTILETVAASPAVRVSELPLMTNAERTRLLVEWNATDRDFAEGTAHGIFEAQVARTPDAVAVVYRGESLTYAELDRRAKHLAQRLRRRGVGRGTRVALMVERSPNTLVGVLGILATGAAYVPLDPAYPEARLAFMLEDTGPTAVLTQRSILDDLPSSAPASTIVCIDDEADDVAHAGAPLPPIAVDPTSPCYVIYTSGSTGRPKGVVMPHRPLVNLIEWQHGASRVARGGRTLQFTPLSFDVSFQEIFSTFRAGGTLVLIDEESRRDPYALLRILDEARIERLFLPFVALKTLSAAATTERVTPRALRCVVTAGEQLQITPEVEAFIGSLGEGALLHNHYGPSEAHVVSAYTLDGPPSGWPRLPPIGRPIANTQLYILDPSRTPVPVGVAGELYIGGACVADGYFGRPDVTAERFVPDPFGVAGARLYRTGDLARFLADGNIEYIGRIDAQVKVRGYRIEPGEIEAGLAALDGVKDAVVIARKDTRGDAMLVAYVVPEPGRQLDVDRAREELGRTMPDYMVPTWFVVLDSFPLTPSGKVDRKALPAPDLASKAAEYIAPRNPLEETLAEIWSDLLGVPKVGVNDKFVELGGHSLLAMRLVTRVRQRLGIELPVRSALGGATLGTLAAHAQTCGSSRAALVERLPRGEGALFPISYEQETFWRWEKAIPGTNTWNYSVTLRLRGPLDVGSMIRTFDEIVRRQESLRTVFRTVGGEPKQHVLARLEELRVVDLRGVDDATREAELDRVDEEVARRPFDLERGPLFRKCLIRIADDDHHLVMATHHLVLGGYSYMLLQREIETIYDALRRDQPNPLPALPFQYADYAAWERRALSEPELARRGGFWRRALDGVAPTLLPNESDRGESRPMVPIARHPFEASRALAEALQALAQQEGVTLFVVLLAAVGVLLHRRTGQETIVVNAPGTAGFSPIGDVIDTMVANFTSQTLVRIDLPRAATFQEILGRVHGFLDQASKHELPLALAHPVENPLGGKHTRVVVNYLPPAPAVGECRASEIGVTKLREGVRMDMRDRCLVFTIMWNEGGLAGPILFPSDLMDGAERERLVADFNALLASVVADPNQRIAGDNEARDDLDGRTATFDILPAS
jgi:surfactin family lipopeptide synthetase A